LTAGAIAGIIIGSVVGILLLIWVVRSCFNLGAPPQEREGLYHDVEPKRHRHHSRHHSHSRPRRYSHTSEVSMPAPVVVAETSRSRSGHRQPAYYYASDDRRGRRYKRTY
jgi:Ni/Co efflux regulator RcnB